LETVAQHKQKRASPGTHSENAQAGQGAALTSATLSNLYLTVRHDYNGTLAKASFVFMQEFLYREKLAVEVKVR